MATATGGTGTVTALSLALFAAIPALAAFQAQRRRRQEMARRENIHVLREQFKRGSICYSDFPPVVKDVLERCKLAYLATVDAENDTSHLSLMRYTYLPEDGVIVMSTNTNTKKFNMLQNQTGVALLVHDFRQFDDGASTGASITLNGRCYIVEPGPDADRFRQEHLRANPRYPQFIVGPDIAILAVEIQKARIADIHDRVTKWSVGEGITPSS
jgi:general stress protein 26